MGTEPYDEPLAEIVQWFLERDILLGFDNVGGGEWMMKSGTNSTRRWLRKTYAVGSTK